MYKKELNKVGRILFQRLDGGFLLSLSSWMPNMRGAIDIKIRPTTRFPQCREDTLSFTYRRYKFGVGNTWDEPYNFEDNEFRFEIINSHVLDELPDKE